MDMLKNNKTIVALIIVIIVIMGAIFLAVGNSNRATLTDRGAGSNERPQTRQATGLKGMSVEYSDGITGYISKPEGDGPFPALVLIHEWWGLNDDIKSITDRFADEGYVALAVDLYHGESTTDPAVARVLSGAVRSDTQPAFDNLADALDYLGTLPYVDTDRLASVGWCFGGGWAYQMAVNGLNVNASVMYYGQFNPEDDFAHMKADILGHFGEEDASISVDTVREFQAALDTTNGMHEVYIYPNVGHGFANVRGGDNLAYSEEAAETAWQRTLEFLNTHIK